MNNVAAIVQARMGSSRLPGKTMLPIVGKPMLELLVERLLRAANLNTVIVATTLNSDDDVIEQLANKLGVFCHRGSEDDVLERVLDAAHLFGVDVIVEITGDCPLIDPEVVDRIVDTYVDNSVDYVSNILVRTYPRGLDTQVFSTKVLEEVAKATSDPVDREHVSLFIYEHPERFALLNVDSGFPEAYGDIRLTVDTQQDFELISAIYDQLYPANPAFSLEEVLQLLKSNPKLLDLNRKINQKRVR